MADQMFLDLDGVDGDVTEAAHAGQMKVLKFKWSESNEASYTGDGRRDLVGVEMRDLEITKRVDRASPELAVACAKGDVFDTAVLSLSRASGGQQEVYMSITLKDVAISSVSYASGQGEDIPAETITMNFLEVEWEFKPLEGGALAAPVKTGYSLAQYQAL